MFKNLYDAILRWAQSPAGPYILFFAAMVESLFSIVSLSAIFIVVAFVAPKRSYRLALICAIGATIGALIGYLIGHFLWLDKNGDYTSFALFFFEYLPGFTAERYQHIHELYNKWGFLVIFTTGFAPSPFELFVYTAGVFNVNLPLFLLAAFASRFLRYGLIAFFIHRFGPHARALIEKYFNWVVLGILLLLIIIIVFVYLVK
jgi:membrane protein YqaA with SNARE-associated domain